MKHKDILLLARPDHSYVIYRALLRTQLRFQYVSFKLFPNWMVNLLNYRRLRSVSRNATINHYLSIYRILRSNLRIPYLSEKNELKIFNRFVQNELCKYTPKIIHYWPIYCGKAVASFKLQHPEVKTFAEIYFPCPKFVIDKMETLLSSYGLESNLDYIKRDDVIFDEIIKYEVNFIVPSLYVAKSYKKYYPNINCFILSYGITLFPCYKRKIINTDDHKFNFVFVGTISLEKGCDILCEYFLKHSEYILHLYGSIIPSEYHLFIKYINVENIIFHGPIAKNQVQPEVAKYDIGIHLSRFDAYSLAVGELIGAGLPVIVSTDTGNSEDIIRHKWGVVTDLNMSEINNAIKCLCTVENYNKYTESIDQYIKSSPETYGNLIVDFYRKHL